MSIDVTCTGCKKSYQVPDKFAGRSAKCKACGAKLRIPKPQPAKQDSKPDAAAIADDEFSGQVAALFEEEFGDGLPELAKPSKKDCPQCGNKLDAASAQCVDCGYNFQEARQVQTAAEAPPVGVEANAYIPPGFEAEPATAIEPHMVKNYKLVWLGLHFVFWAFVVTVPIVAWDIYLEIFTSGSGGGISVILDFVLFAAGLLSFAGRILCLWVPKETGAKPIIITTILLDLAYLLRPVLNLLLGGVVVGTAAAGQVGISLGTVIVGLLLTLAWNFLPVITAIVFVFFLRALAAALRNPLLREKADGVIAAMIAAPIVLVLCLISLAILIGRMSYGGVLVLFINFVVLIGVDIWLLVTLVRYGILLWGLIETVNSWLRKA